MKIISLVIAFLLSTSLFGQFEDHFLTPKKKKELWGFFDGRKKVVDYQYSDYKKDSKSNCFLVKKEDKWGILSNLGEVLLPITYDSLSLYGAPDSNFIALKNDLYGIIDIKGNPVLPFEYENIQYYMSKNTKVDGLLKKDGNWGVLRNGEIDFDADTMVFARPERLAMFTTCNPNKNDYKEEKKCAEMEMLKFIYKNISYPKEARKNGVEGTAVASFLVSPKGEVLNVEMARDIGAGTGEETLRLLNTMSNWVPAEQDGQKVWSKFFIPIRFKLE